MNKVTIDDLTLDELVSGNLRGERYRQVLLAMEAGPHWWRQCALAFLREQALQQDLRSLLQGDVDWLDRGASEAERSDTLIAGEGVLLGQPSDAAAAPVIGSRTTHSPAWLQRFAVMAAMLLVSFSVGWLGAGMRLKPKDSLVSSSASGEGASLGSVLSGGSAQTAPSNTAPTRGHRSRGPAQLLGNPAPLDMDLPAELLELQNAGKIRIESYEAIMPVVLNDGSSAIMPYQQFRVVPTLYSY